MTCGIFGTGQTNILALSYLFGKTWPAHSRATQATEINTIDQITGKVIDVSFVALGRSLISSEVKATCQ